MGGKGLGELIAGFLEADGLVVERPAPHCLAGSRRDGAGGTRQCYVWFRDPERGIEPDPKALLADFATASGVLGDDAQGFFVTPSLAGISSEFRQQASAAGIGVRVPVQFFDTAYRDQGGQAFGAGRGRAAVSHLRDFERRSAALAAMRVPQPFETMSAAGAGPGGFSAGPDLLVHLMEELAAPAAGPQLTIVLGNAGAGKSYLFSALFAGLHRHFLAEKAAQRMAARPVTFQPEDIRSERVGSLAGLLEAVARTNAVESATSPALMRFLNREGFTTWMFDGLDEFFAGEGDFITELEACLAPASRARVLVCTRDSLLTTSSALKGLIDRRIASGNVRLYELARWQRPAQRALAFVRRTGRLPGEGGTADPPEVAQFLAGLDASPAASELATLPYYCDLMLELAARGEAGPKDEFELLAAVVDGLVDREQGKLASGELGFRWDVFSGADTFVGVGELVDAWGSEAFAGAQDRERLLAVLDRIGRDRLIELIEGIAHQMRTSVAYPNESKGLAIEEIEDLANYYLDVGVEPDLEPRVLLALVQLAFFGAADTTGHVRFAHEIVADFLAAREAMRILARRPDNPDSIAQALGVRHDLDRSIILRYLTRQLAGEPDLAGSVRAHIEAGRVRERSAAGAGQLLDAMRGAGL
jgi:hypothetical protein